MEKLINDINVNERFLKESSMTMKKGKTKLCSNEEAEAGAERYIRLLRAPECREFFLKVMFYLPYPDRERIYEMSTRPKVASPKHYFTYSAKRALAKRGY